VLFSGHEIGAGSEHELVDLAGRMPADEAAEDVGEIGLEVDR
jgi:hypothetical protein